MKKYNPLIIEAENEYHISYNNRYIIDTDHSIQRYTERYKDIISADTVYKVIGNVIKEILNKYKDREGKYGYHSKSTGIGGIIHWRLDGKRKNNFNNAVIVSLFPIKKLHNFYDVDARIIVEKQLIEWAKEKGFKNIKKQNLCESYYDDHYNQGDNFYVSFFEGKLYDSKLDYYILID